MAMMKYRVHEVAKDFNTTSKVITQILTDYATTPKNHMQVLENPELDVIFEYMTQHNQVASLEDIFKVAPPEKKPEPQSEKASGEKAPAGKATETRSKAQVTPVQDKSAPQQPQTQSQQSTLPQKKKENKPHVPRQVAEKRVVDTRGGAAVNIEKYNEKFEDMAGNKANSSKMRSGGGNGNKEKIKSQAKQRQQAQQQSPAKRRQEERDRQNRLQRELAKKKPLVVEIPDQISVGELASRRSSSSSKPVFLHLSPIRWTMIRRHLLQWNSAVK